ncbi:MAG TPA: 6-phosphogluconolactonase [Patescibacteria group bacterium]|nr:6-phosphogluconolactonase [Patescibacteria group bacterium]
MQFFIVKDIQAGLEKAKEILAEEVDKKTVLFLSGGSTPAPLYETLAKEKLLHPAGVGLIDERFGEPMHEKSNELMISKTGLMSYLETERIPFYSMLQKGYDREQDARDYDQTLRNLFFQIPKSIGILGIGTDGHIAGIAPNRAHFNNPLFEKEQEDLYVSEFDDPTGPFGQRITMTFAGLSLLDFLLVFVFGKEKQKALQKTFTPGKLEEIPARFFQQTDIAKKTLFITDQKI